MKRFILVALVLCVLVGVASAWGASMGAWDYRKEITINNTGSNLTDYQLMFTVNRSAGSDSGFTTYLNGKCESDYDDIRFTTSDENTLCDYWIESSSSTVATIWVEVPSIVNSTAYGSTTMYLYYGNSAASAVSDGDATFPFFDDFPGSELDTGKWSVTGSSPTVSGGQLTIPSAGSGSAYIKGNVLFSFPAIFACSVKFQSASYTSNIMGVSTNTLSEILSFTSNDAAAGARGFAFSGSNVLTGAFTTVNPTQNFERRTIKWVDSSNAQFYIDDVLVGSIANAQVPGSNTAALLGNWVDTASNQDIYFKWVYVCGYTATEPTVSAWGSEEVSSCGLSSVTAALGAISPPNAEGYAPVLVSFTDGSTGTNCTIDSWNWSFGDGYYSNAQNPQHYYLSSGMYAIKLTSGNISCGKYDGSCEDAGDECTLYVVSENTDIPVADFTVTETCGETSDIFYFIDFSTGGGLYAWNWSFGDGAYSELRNPTHQYSSNGTYDVGLSVWGAYGNDTLTRSNLITIPCGAATPTPTVTPTVTGTPVFTEGNATFIYAPDQDYVPFPIWLAIVIVTIALFGHSIIFLKNSDLTAIMAALFAMVSAWLSNMIGYIDVQVTSYAEEIVISPVVQAVHPPWLVYTMLIFAFVSVMNIFAAIYKVYLKPVPWNEIYDRKLPKWERRK